MNIRKYIKSVTLSVLSALMTLGMSHAIAGGPEIAPSSFWMIYLGAFGGSYNNSFNYGSNYFDSAAFTETFGNEFHQRGVSGGGQIGLQYHFNAPVFISLGFSGMSNSAKGQYATFVITGITAGVV